MIYSLLVLSSPSSGHATLTAARFAHALLASGHTIYRVFFLDEGVRCGSAMGVIPQDETDPQQLWLQLARDNGVDLVLCISSALRRGMLDTTEAQRYEKSASTIEPGFNISGLGQLLDAGAHSDRLVTFGG